MVIDATSSPGPGGPMSGPPAQSARASRAYDRKLYDRRKDSTASTTSRLLVSISGMVPPGMST